MLFIQKKKEKNMTTKLTKCCIIVFVLSALISAQAADLYYSASGPGYYPWDNVSGWIRYAVSGGGAYGQLPTTNDNVLISATTPKAENGNAITVTNGVFAECNIFASGQNNHSGTAWFRLDGGSLTCNAHFFSGRFYPGLATLESGILYCAENFYVSSAGGRGTVTNNGATVEAQELRMSTQSVASPSVLVQNNGSLTSRGLSTIGEKGDALVVLNGGTLACGYALYIGGVSGSGYGVVTNNGAVISVSHSLIMGYQAGAYGRLVHNAGNIDAKNYLQIGRNGGIGVFEAHAPFSANTMIIGTGLAPDIPGTGTVILAEGAVGTVDDFLRVNNGDLFMRGGQIHLQNVGNENVTNLFVRTGEDRRGQIRGWGKFTNVNASITLRMINNGQVIADGEGVERDLDFNMIAVVNNEFLNGADGTNGWYAVNKGRVNFPRIWQEKFSPGTTYCWGDLVTKTTPEMVNSVGLSFSTELRCYVRGGFCAADRNDIPAGLLKGNLRPIGIWCIGAYSDKLLLAKASFSSVSLDFRYDHTKVLPNDSSLRLFRYNGSSWDKVGGCVPDGTSLISTDTTLTPVTTGDYNIGWFAVMAVESTGTEIVIQ